MTGKQQVTKKESAKESSLHDNHEDSKLSYGSDSSF